MVQYFPGCCKSFVCLINGMVFITNIIFNFIEREQYSVVKVVLGGGLGI